MSNEAPLSASVPADERSLRVAFAVASREHIRARLARDRNIAQAMAAAKRHIDLFFDGAEVERLRLARISAREDLRRLRCDCRKCRRVRLSDPNVPRGLRSIGFVVCETCGNKRCPHATDHELACTNSNEPGQKGSEWENCK